MGEPAGSGFQLGGWSRVAVLWLVVLALILIPFMMFGETVDAWFVDFSRSNTSAMVVGLAGLGLLFADIAIPVPSSLVVAVMGKALDWGAASLLSALALTCGHWLGYWGGYRLPRSSNRGGASAPGLPETKVSDGWRLAAFVAITRPVPVLAEAFAVQAGYSRMSSSHFLATAFLANLGACSVFAAVGANAMNMQDFVVLFLATMTLPAVAYGLVRLVVGRAKE